VVALVPATRTRAAACVAGELGGFKSRFPCELGGFMPCASVGLTSSMSDTVCGATGHGLSVSGDSSPAWPVYARAGYFAPPASSRSNSRRSRLSSSRSTRMALA
jgi:hypothetical protein